MVKVKTNAESFNLWHDHKLVDFLDAEAQFLSYLKDGSGLADVPISLLKRALKRAEELGLNQDMVKAIQSDIKAAKEVGDEYVQYYCY
ncbi:MAG: hypothetical protein Q8O05_00235 [Chloroflexota bacterium]|nr:hypothetical protein [Chloroflexota bacterium]